jgi:5,10-methylenetetrahydromethanopterin reductase
VAVEFWMRETSLAWRVPDRAVRAEQLGFDGLGFVDSQNLRGDWVSALAVSADRTTTLRLGPAVSNPVARHPAAVAASLVTLQELAGGRIVFGLGRGDSSMAMIGMSPAPVRDLEVFASTVQRYLGGEGVAFSELPIAPGRDVAKLRLVGHYEDSRLAFLGQATQPKVPVQIAASGPRVLGVAGRLADGVLVCLGANPARLSWARDMVYAAARDHNRADLPTMAAVVNIVVDDDVERARRIGRGGLATMLRFASMQSHASGPLSDDDRRQLESISRNYDMTKHGSAAAAHASLSADFLDRFGIFGPASYCAERLAELVELGFSRFLIAGASADAPPSERDEMDRRIADDLIKRLR